MYSLFHLGHNQFFSKITRTTNMMLAFSWQALVVSVVLYNTRSVYEPGYPGWVIPFTVVAAQPVTYIFGWVFIRRIYTAYMEKFGSIERLLHYVEHENPISLRDKHELEVDILRKEEKVYTLYFLYYGISMPLILACWAISVHLLQETYNGDTHLHPIW